ncbi:MAG: hypothetical protein SFZ24_02945 [Planctomycetota bacterium]|nr:hypothetical protein [Planctomycetota bacterium]
MRGTTLKIAAAGFVLTLASLAGAGEAPPQNAAPSIVENERPRLTRVFERFRDRLDTLVSGTERRVASLREQGSEDSATEELSTAEQRIRREADRAIRSLDSALATAQRRAQRSGATAEDLQRLNIDAVVMRAQIRAVMRQRLAALNEMTTP